MRCIGFWRYLYDLEVDLRNNWAFLVYNYANLANPEETIKTKCMPWIKG